MARYRVTMQEICTYVFDVEAEDWDAAQDRAYDVDYYGKTIDDWIDEREIKQLIEVEPEEV